MFSRGCLCFADPQRQLQALKTAFFFFFFLGKKHSLPFVFAKRGGVLWTMIARQPFHTLRDCSLLGTVLIQLWLKSHTCSKESDGKMEGNLLLTAVTQKSGY